MFVCVNHFYKSISGMSHGQFVGRETIFQEYKELSFQHVGLPFDDEVAEKYLDTFSWENFNSLVETTLQKYIQIYLPKYACAFLDHHTPSEEPCSLTIGVDDSGFITGIPYQGVLTKEMFITGEVIAFLKKKLIFSKDGQDVDVDIYDILDIQVIPVSYQNRNLPQSHPQLEIYRKKKKELQKKIQQHSKKYMKWQAHNDLYSAKLVELYDNPTSRSVFLRYLRKNEKFDMIERIKRGEKIQQQSYEKIREFRENVDNLYYWLCTWKDEMLDKIRLNRPLREKSYKNILSRMETIYSPSHILIKAGELVPWWMQSNEGMNLYIVRFVFKKGGLQVRFIDHLNRSVKCYRTLVKDQPCCLPYI